MLSRKEALMPASHRSALLALGAALALCACKPEARAQPEDAQPTPSACAGPSDPACGPDAYCKAESALNAGGRCAPRPQMCPMIYQPVCGADGRTYPNACHAARAGVNLAHDGACEPPVHGPQ
jgi:hypothetical protein